ncbi:fasciclin domain-containing protein [Hyphomonas sp.]|uniref:fasciclin domain-containing protein n=1 Tax=Hyphomonas sp. TaxID=87 RepID=UPI00391D7A90
MKILASAAAAALLIALPAAAGHHADGKKKEAGYGDAQLTSGSYTPAAGDIVETAAAAGTFNTLLAAAEAAGLAEALKGDGPFTVFAPTDEAFAKLPEGTVESLLLPENQAQLAGILQYHVIAGAKVKSGDIAGQQLSAGTLNGQLDIDATDGVRINGEATVIAADVRATNGIIHVIDTVLIPAS